MKKTKEPTPPVKDALLAALDTEHAHAATRKDGARMTDIDALRRLLGDNGKMAPASTPLPPVALKAAPGSVLAFQGDPPMMPIPLPSAPGMKREDLSIGEIIRRADPMPASDERRREVAKGLLRIAVLEASRVDDQARYEVAFQALNRNLTAMQLCQEEATTRGMSVEELAQQIIAERQIKARCTMHAHAVLARVSAEIDQASGDAIDQAVTRGIAEIEGME